jgi:DNA-binding LacI/PurR family transcriptional regulator
MPKARTYLYEQVIENVIGLVCDKDLTIGSRLPSERNLAKHFNCSYLTIRKAMALMIERQILERRHGSGTYLRSPVEKLKLCKGTKVSFRPSNLMAMIIQPDIGRFTVNLLTSLMRTCAERGIELVMHPLADFNDAALTLPSQLAEQGCKAILIPRISHYADTSRLHEFISRCEIPVVLSIKHKGLEHLSYEKPLQMGILSRREMRFACKYLTTLGYEHIFYVSPDLPSTHLPRIKMEEYITIMKAPGMKGHLEILEKDFRDIDGIIDRMSAYRRKAAIICYDDDYALRLMTALYKRSFSVPEDFALFGCNNIEVAAYSEPPLSTFEFLYDYVAESFISEALSRCETTPHEKIPLPDTAPVIRESCGGSTILGEKLEKIVNEINMEVNHEIPSK